MTTPAQFRQKPVDAIQLDAKNRDDISRWLNGGYSGRDGGGKNAWYYWSNGDSELYVKNEGFETETAKEGDWIIKDSLGRVSVCTPVEFETLYEPA